MKPELLAAVDGCEVWHGDCLDPDTAATVMRGRTDTNPGGHERVADLLHVDAPYSDKTHDWHKAGKMTADSRAGWAKRNPGRSESYYAARQAEVSDLPYPSWSPAQVASFVGLWLPVVSGWFTTITDNVLAPDWSAALELSGLYTFSPLAWVELGSRVRMVGDGPAQWSCQVIVARPRKEPWSKWGALPGAYVAPGENAQNRPDRITGAKSFALTCQFLQDYSRPGALVLDPCLGGGTTLSAARATGRRCIGVELDRGRAELCVSLLTGAKQKDKRQEALFK